METPKDPTPSRRRGPAPGQVTTPLPQKAEEGEIRLHDDKGPLPVPPIIGWRCNDGCGRITPGRKTGSRDGKSYETCTLCGVGYVVTRDETGRAVSLRRVR